MTGLVHRMLIVLLWFCFIVFKAQKGSFHITPLILMCVFQALLEEKSVCARASNKKIYLNVAINTLKKLRDEVVRSSDSSDQELKSPTKNPLALSHAAVLDGARAANTKFTLKRSGGQIKLPAHLTCM